MMSPMFLTSQGAPDKSVCVPKDPIRLPELHTYVHLEKPSRDLPQEEKKEPCKSSHHIDVPKRLESYSTISPVAEPMKAAKFASLRNAQDSSSPISQRANHSGQSMATLYSLAEIVKGASPTGTTSSRVTPTVQSPFHPLHASTYVTSASTTPSYAQGGSTFYTHSSISEQSLPLNSRDQDQHVWKMNRCSYFPRNVSEENDAPLASPRHTIQPPSPVLHQEPARSEVRSNNDHVYVWEYVLRFGVFPRHICSTEHELDDRRSTMAGVKRSRWNSVDGSELASKVVIAPSSSSGTSDSEQSIAAHPLTIHDIVANTLEHKSSCNGPKYRRLSDAGASSYPSQSSERARGKFDPLSLKSIMNEESKGSSEKQRCSKVLKRSDYSQHTVVRSGRWSDEEEKYAKAMIEAFKTGILPLDGNISLRKFLSEMLVCHPMRISKKFVGYVRKYHWYRVGASSCTPEAKHNILMNLCYLERMFWASYQSENQVVVTGGNTRMEF